MRAGTVALLCGLLTAGIGTTMALALPATGPWAPYGLILLIIYFSAVVYFAVLRSSGGFWSSAAAPFSAATWMILGSSAYMLIDIYVSRDALGGGTELVWGISLIYLVAMGAVSWLSAWKRRDTRQARIDPGRTSMSSLSRALKRKGYRAGISGSTLEISGKDGPDATLEIRSGRLRSVALLTGGDETLRSDLEAILSADQGIVQPDGG